MFLSFLPEIHDSTPQHKSTEPTDNAFVLKAHYNLPIKSKPQSSRLDASGF